VASDKGVTVAVDTRLTPELEQEGYARDLVRNVNILRKDAGLELDDRIHLTMAAEGEVAEAVNNFSDYIQQETLALSLKAGTGEEGEHQQNIQIDGNEVKVWLHKA
jgi:isoleucyl-tRNA synthetase